jgi:hypothetical protein
MASLLQMLLINADLIDPKISGFAVSDDKRQRRMQRPSNAEESFIFEFDGRIALRSTPDVRQRLVRRDSVE